MTSLFVLGVPDLKPLKLFLNKVTDRLGAIAYINDPSELELKEVKVVSEIDKDFPY